MSYQHAYTRWNCAGDFVLAILALWWPNIVGLALGSFSQMAHSLNRNGLGISQKKVYYICSFQPKPSPWLHPRIFSLIIIWKKTCERTCFSFKVWSKFLFITNVFSTFFLISHTRPLASISQKSFGVGVEHERNILHRRLLDFNY